MSATMPTRASASVSVTAPVTGLAASGWKHSPKTGISEEADSIMLHEIVRNIMLPGSGAIVLPEAFRTGLRQQTNPIS